MARGKIESVLKRLKEIEKWATMGLSEKQIAYNLGISRSTLESYKKRNSDILDTLRRGKNIATFKVENALYKKAIGHTIKEIKPIKIKEEYYDDKDRKCTIEKVVEVEVTKEIPPDITAIKFYLINRDKNNWKENPSKNEIDKAVLDIRKKQAEQGEW